MSKSKIINVNILNKSSEAYNWKKVLSAGWLEWEADNFDFGCGKVFKKKYK